MEKKTEQHLKQVSENLQVQDSSQQLTGQRAGAIDSLGHLNEWWLVEIWKENREVFKALIAHILIFGLFIGALTLFHYIFSISNLPPHRKELLEMIDFYSIVLALCIFGTSFVLKLVVLTLNRKKNDKE